LAAVFALLCQPPLSPIGERAQHQGVGQVHADDLIQIELVHTISAAGAEAAGGAALKSAESAVDISNTPVPRNDGILLVQPGGGSNGALGASATPHTGLQDQNHPSKSTPIGTSVPTLEIAQLQGDRDGSTEILAQIAKCLDPGVAPDLPHTKLQISLNERGQLLAPPMIDFGSETPPADTTLLADRVVQAALQCGPYVRPVHNPATLVLAIEFSKVMPAEGSD
jgi:hypothetical protein